MDRSVVLLEGESCRNLLLALAHTLWQGALAAALLLLYLRRTPAQAAHKRYLAALAALAAILLGGLLTWSILSYEPTDTRAIPAPAVASGGDVATTRPVLSALPTTQGRPPTSPEPLSVPHRWQIWLLEAWLAGVAVMLVAPRSHDHRRRPAATTVPTSGGLKDARTRATTAGQDGHQPTRPRPRRRADCDARRDRLSLADSAAAGRDGQRYPRRRLAGHFVHELTHIKHYDYLVNFVQMVVEALLFFNPTVWWISRQIRIEREACCDAAGVRWTGESVKYAEALVAWAQRTAAPAPAVGFGKDADVGSTLDRLRRILIAGHRPQPRVPWHIATAMVVLTLACLMLLQQTTSLAVTLAGQILTPQERIERIGELSQEYGSPEREYGPKDGIEVSGVVRTWDSAPIPTGNRLDND